MIRRALRNSTDWEVIGNGLGSFQVLLIQEILNRNESVDPHSLYNSIYTSAILGWSIIDRRSTATYSEIVSSGHLRLIRNSNLRQEVIHYYSLWESESLRATKRQSDYPNLIYKIFDHDNPTDNIDWFYESINKSGADIEFRKEFRHEINYGNFLRDQFLVNTERVYLHLKEVITTELEID
ncbi:MAG: hypothetical protein O2887_16705 [Bacteroidetes bacterium]|nr:hypothetical protein [Bacteroidota bacterium]MDA1122102.1 hypothetical protein [Bacteroidota bacterium]